MDRLQSFRAVRRHIDAETADEYSVDAILDTVSDDVFFAVPGGLVLADPGTVRGYYSNRAGSYVVRASRQLTSITTDWYVLNDSSATLLGTGDVGGIDATGREWVVNSVVLFPTAEDGIRGEICATRMPFEDVLRGVPVPPGDALANTALIDEPRFAPHHTYAVRVNGEVQAGEGPWRPLFEGDATILGRHVSDWYVFTEHRDQAGNKLALIRTVEDGAFALTLGYGCCDETDSTSPTR